MLHMLYELYSMFQLYVPNVLSVQTNVTSVLSGCCKNRSGCCIYIHVASICSVFICFIHIFANVSSR
jgi:hypothetical protein